MQSHKCFEYNALCRRSGVALIRGRCLIEDSNFDSENGIRAFSTHTDSKRIASDMFVSLL